jgi:hypothetical protein
LYLYIQNISQAIRSLLAAESKSTGNAKSAWAESSRFCLNSRRSCAADHTLRHDSQPSIHDRITATTQLMWHMPPQNSHPIGQDLLLEPRNYLDSPHGWSPETLSITTK